MDSKTVTQVTRQLTAELTRQFTNHIKDQFEQYTPPEKIAEFLSYPDEDIINFQFTFPVKVKTIKQPPQQNSTTENSKRKTK